MNNMRKIQTYLAHHVGGIVIAEYVIAMAFDARLLARGETFHPHMINLPEVEFWVEWADATHRNLRVLWNKTDSMKGNVSLNNATL